jgi:hypothetical protein
LDRGQVERNSWQVMKYLESWHSIEPSAQGSDEPYDRKAKGSSRPPCSDSALDLIEANTDASLALSRPLEEMMNSGVEAYGIRASVLLRELRDKPGLLPNIRAAGGEEWKALRRFCLLLAQVVAVRWDGPDGPYVLRVRVSRREVEEALRDPNTAPPGKARTWTAHDAYRIIDSQVEELMGEGMSEAAARGYLMDRGVSGPRISRARAFVREERGVA